MKQRKDGYVLEYVPGHPFAVDGYVLKHRLVMERHLGRYLTPSEVVHHKDNNPRNNRLSNLQLSDQPAHRRLHWEQLTPEEQQAHMAKMHERARTPEARAKMSASRRGNQNRKGKPHDAEVRARIAASLTGQKRGPTPEEVRKRIAASLQGRTTRGTGWKHSEEAKRKMSEAAKARAARRRANQAAGPQEDTTPPASGTDASQQP